MYWIGVLLATIGAGLILGALTFVSTLIGVLVNAMIVLMAGPLIDRALARRESTRELALRLGPGLRRGRGAQGRLVVDLEAPEQLP